MPPRSPASPRTPPSGATTRRPRALLKEKAQLEGTTGEFDRAAAALADARALDELAEEAGDESTRAEAAAHADRGRPAGRGARVPAHALRRAGRRQRHRRGEERRRRRGGHGLGRHALPDVRALLRAEGLGGRARRPRGRRGGRHLERLLHRAGRVRLRIPQGRARRAPAGAHQPLRPERPPPDQLRRGRRHPGDRRRHRHRHQGVRRPHRHLPLLRRRRPEGEQDRLGGPHDPHPHRHRGGGAERAEPAEEPGRGLEDPPLPPLRARGAEAAGAARRRRGPEEGHRLRVADPQLRAAALPDGEGPAHRRGDGEGRRRARRRARRVHPALPARACGAPTGSSTTRIRPGPGASSARRRWAGAPGRSARWRRRPSPAAR